VKNQQFDLGALIRACPDFPRPGILFRDINPVLRNYHALKYIAKEFYCRFRRRRIQAVAGIESRGFIIATAIALKFGVGIILVRKAGKLPGPTISKAYNIEYGTSVMEIQKDAVENGQGILVADDLIATGGTATAAAQLIEELGGKVLGLGFVIELANLDGGQKLRNSGYKVDSLSVYY
jgi:adenine phosphoribosyltransferase